MLTPRRILVFLVLVVVLLTTRGGLPEKKFHLPRVNLTTIHIPNLGRPAFIPGLVPNISGPAVDLYTLPGEQSYPRALRLHSGPLLASLTTYTPENTIALSISHNHGLTFYPHSIVAVAPTSNIHLNSAFILELPSTRLLCAFEEHTLNPEEPVTGAQQRLILGGQNGEYLYYKLMIYFSDDVGKTWGYLSTPVQESGSVHGLWEPFLRVAGNGDLQFYYSREEGKEDQDDLMLTSADGGKTWGVHTSISGRDVATRDGMVGIQELEMGSGVLIAVFESMEMKGENRDSEASVALWCVVSRDDGRTWGERRLIYEGFWEEPPMKRNAGAPQIALVEKTLVVSFMTDEVKLEGMWHRNAFVKIITSDDGGTTWGSSMIIADMPAAWTGLLVLNDTDFLVLCEHHSRVEARPVSLVPKKRAGILGGRF